MYNRTYPHTCPQYINKSASYLFLRTGVLDLLAGLLDRRTGERERRTGVRDLERPADADLTTRADTSVSRLAFLERPTICDATAKYYKV